MKRRNYSFDFKKCFGVCGCCASGQCINCNSSYFIGYDNQLSISSWPILTTAPNSNGAICSTNTEYTDVSKINVIR